MPLAMAASRGPQSRLDPTTVAAFCPDCVAAKLNATLAGGNSAPEIIAATVSRM